MTVPAQPTPSPGTEILWDTWGVPHIVARDAQSLFFAFGWAQAHNHGDLLLRLYGQARGKGAEYFGEALLVSDRAVRTMRLPRYAVAWYEAQETNFRANLDAFAAGINAYAAAHPTAIASASQQVLPVTATDVLDHAARMFYAFVAGFGGYLWALPAGTAYGSNGWAIAPSHTTGGHALLLANPHLFWGEEMTFFEAQLTAPGVYNAYGATLVGIPVLVIAFNDRLGWTLTVNTIDPGDLYALDVVDGGYRVDGEVIPFETVETVIRVRQPDGTPRDEPVSVRHSLFGPVVAQEEATLALRIAAFAGETGAAGALQQWWDMGRAQNLAEFEGVLQRLQIPMFTIIYADADGHIMSLFNGHVALRPEIDVDWSGIVPGDTRATLWQAIHPYADLPKVIDPPGGWVQNSNSPPWTTTFPPQLDPDAFPPYLAPRWLSWRERRAIRMLEENPRLSLDRLIALKYSTRLELADRVVDDLIAAARASGDATAARAADVLAAWDREANSGSRGALLFAFWVTSLESAEPRTLSDLFAIPADPFRPLQTPAGLADPAAAARALVQAAGLVEAAFGSLDVPWGDVARLRRGGRDEPANGFEGDPFGVFRLLRVDLSQIATGEPAPVLAGDTYVAAVEFAPTVRARVLMTYGNASQPGSPHIGDQLPLSSRGEMRQAWLTRAEVEANLEEREVLG